MLYQTIIKIEGVIMMQILRKLRNTIGLVLFSTMLSLGLSTPGYSAMLGTQEIIAGDTALQQKDYVKELLSRDEVRDQLISMGVDPDNAKQRVDSMTQEEVQAMAGKLDQLPAGGDALTVAAVVLIVLLITDLLDITNVYNL